MITDEQAKAIAASAEAAKAGLELTSRGMDALGKLGGDALAEITGMATDQLKVWRYKKWLMLMDGVREEHKRRGIEGKTVPIPPKLALPIIEAASLEDEETLQGVWAKLIANAMDSDYAEKIHPAYIEIIKQLSADEALILGHLSLTPEYPTVVEIQYETSNAADGYEDVCQHFVAHFADMGLKSKDKAVQYLDNLLRLRILTYNGQDSAPVAKLNIRKIDGGNASTNYDAPKEDEPNSEELEEYISRKNEVDVSITTDEYLKVSDFGMAFIKACISDT